MSPEWTDVLPSGRTGDCEVFSGFFVCFTYNTLFYFHLAVLSKSVIT